MKQGQNIARLGRLMPLVAALITSAFPILGADPPGTPATRTFQVKGAIRRLVPEGNVLVIKHEEIPGYMAAMTMPLEV
ncbi:MAG: hypothetical protein KDM81_09945, partial [Verrucomicrobiae bacterium]|nr:hypothetical protein [Verrucomicrobiae bacterium]